MSLYLKLSALDFRLVSLQRFPKSARLIESQLNLQELNRLVLSKNFQNQKILGCLKNHLNHLHLRFSSAVLYVIQVVKSWNHLKLFTWEVNNSLIKLKIYEFGRYVLCSHFISISRSLDRSEFNRARGKPIWKDAKSLLE